MNPTTLDNRELQVNVDNLQHAFGENDARKQVLFDNMLKIRAGEVVIMTGPSGSGKTTLLTLIGTLRRVQEGSLQILGEELNGMRQHDIVRLRANLGFIFQAHNLFESLTAAQNVMMATELVGMDRRQARQRTGDLLTELGLGDRIDYKPDSLSGGQKQRVAVARGLIHSPRVILADEPTAALDEKSSRKVVEILQYRAQEEGSTVIIVTHDNRILDVADRIINMVDGRIKSDIHVKQSAAICAYLRGLPMFSDLPTSGLLEIAQEMKEERYRKGDRIIREGDAGDRFFLIAEGSVDVLRVGADGVETRVNPTGIHPGGFFGEVALVENRPRNASIMALEDTVCYTLTRETFLEVVNRCESFEEELQKVIFYRQ